MQQFFSAYELMLSPAGEVVQGFACGEFLLRPTRKASGGPNTRPEKRRVPKPLRRKESKSMESKGSFFFLNIHWKNSFLLPFGEEG